MGTDNSKYGVSREDIIRAAMADFDDFDEPSAKVVAQPQPQADVYSGPSVNVNPIDYSNNYDAQQGYNPQPDYGMQEPVYAAPSVVYCTACGNEVPADSRFCTACGTPVDNAQQVQYQYDDITVLADDGMYGQDPSYADPYAPNPYAQADPYNQQNAYAEPYAQADPYAQQDPYAANPYDQGASYGGEAVVFCTGCGAQMSASMSFCTTCGTPLNNPDNATPYVAGYDDPFAAPMNVNYAPPVAPEPKKKKGFFSK